MFRSKRTQIICSAILMLTLMFAVSACKKKDDGGGGNTAFYAIGGTSSNLTGTVVLQNNGGDDLATTASAFTFSTSIADGASYSVTVFTQPSGQSCAVSNGSGTVSGANVTKVSVSCTTIGVSGDTSAILTWSAPTTNEDGTTLTDLAGYKVYYGTATGAYSTTTDIGLSTACTYTVTNLASGTYYFAVTAYNAAGAESVPSNEGSKVIQ